MTFCVWCRHSLPHLRTSPDDSPPIDGARLASPAPLHGGEDQQNTTQDEQPANQRQQDTGGLLFPRKSGRRGGRGTFAVDSRAGIGSRCGVLAAG